MMVNWHLTVKHTSEEPIDTGELGTTPKDMEGCGELVCVCVCVSVRRERLKPGVQMRKRNLHFSMCEVAPKETSSDSVVPGSVHFWVHFFPFKIF